MSADSSRAIIALLGRLAKAGPQTVYEIDDEFGDNQIILEDDYAKAKAVTGIKHEGEEQDATDGKTYTVGQPIPLYRVKVSGDDEVELLIPAADYRALKAHNSESYYFQAFGYNCVLDKNYFSVGCQSHSLDTWEKDYEKTIRGYLGYSDSAQEAITAFPKALPLLRELQASLNRRKPAKKKAKPAKKKARR